jgi:cysteinyl-tRNA synthetase
MRLYNSIYKKVVDFKPLNPEVVTMYSCGPTVYKDAHIGNFRTYTLTDLIYRALKFYNYNVKFIMNLTDVGHLVGDSDEGEDKVEKSAREEGKSAKEITTYYTNKFLTDYDRLKLNRPLKFTKASEYIDAQIKLIRTLEQKGYTYKTSDGIYYDTSKFENYGQLSGIRLDSVKEGARVEVNEEKKNPTDFALWKFSDKEEKRQQEWMSPWGMGFPGWHIECSAMCLTELGDTVDIHVGADDLKMVHHQNEIAQSEAATDKKFVKYWVHGGFLTVDETTMSKSLGNIYTVDDVISNGFDPMSLRYFYMTAHYRIPLNFSWNALKNAQNSLFKVYEMVETLEEKSNAEISEKHMVRFNEAIENDLNMPKALAVMWDLLKSDLSGPTKIATLLKMDKIFGFSIDDHVGFEIPENISNLAKSRAEYRKSGIWDKADMVRKEILALGYILTDKPDNTFDIRRKL